MFTSCAWWDRQEFIEGQVAGFAALPACSLELAGRLVDGSIGERAPGHLSALRGRLVVLDGRHSLLQDL